MRIVIKFASQVGCALLLSVSIARSQNYLPAPVPASFTQDSNTTFLVDMTTSKTNADYALGSSSLIVNSNWFLPGSGYTNIFGFSTAGNWPTNAWTVEMIIDVPYSMSSTDTIILGAITNTLTDLRFVMNLNTGSGVGMTFYSYGSSSNWLNAEPAAGGNGYSIQSAATDKSVYLAFGCDFSNELYMVSAREVSGAILNSNTSFLPAANIFYGNTNGHGIQNIFVRSLPTTFMLGNSAVLIKSLRISNIYRSNLFTVTPSLPQSNSTNWLPTNLDPSRATNQTVSRTVGYAANQEISMLVTEPYLPVAPGSAPFSIQLTNVPIGLYTFYLYGQIAPNGRTNLNQVWKPCSMDFTATDAGGALLAEGRMPIKEYLVPQRMMGFQFHLDTQPTNVTLAFSVTPDSVETPWIEWISMVDDLAGLPNVAIKTNQTIFSGGATNQDTVLTTNRMQRDDVIWNSLALLDVPFQVQQQVPQFEQPPAGVTVDTWITKAFLGLQGNQTPPFVFSALDLLDTNSSVTFPAGSVLGTSAWPDQFPEHSTGVFFSQSNHPSLTTDIYNTKRAELLGSRVSLFLGAIINPNGQFYGSDLPQMYFSTGDTNTGHDAALALVRWAYDWPAVECNLNQLRYCLMSPDLVFGVDESIVPPGNGYQFGGGKIQGNQDASDAIQLFDSYDQLFPYIQNNQTFANAVHRYIPWVNTPQDVIRLLDRYLVFSTVRDVNNGEIDPSAGVPGYAGQVEGPSPYTASLFDLTHLYSVIYPSSGGTYQEMYGVALSRSGTEYIGSFMVYALGSANSTINQSYMIYWAKIAGIPVPMDLSDTNAYPKVAKATDYLINMWVAGGFPFMIGDASGGPHSSLFGGQANAMSVLGASAQLQTLGQVWEMCQDRRYAWLLHTLWNSNNTDILAAAATIGNPILTNESRVVPDWGAVVEMTPTETNLLDKTAATIRLGVGSGHVHSDYLDLNLFAMGMPLSVNLACRNDSGDWSLPSAAWALVANHALAHTTLDASAAGTQTGEPWLKAFAPPLVRGGYNNGQGTQLDRQSFLMQIGSTNQYYAFDVQWLTGGTYHTWAFHGCESSNLLLNVPMSSGGGYQWLDDDLPGTQLMGSGTNTLQAIWTMTRAAQTFDYSANGGGTLTTVACEPTVLGANYNPTLPPVQVRATLLGRSNDVVLQGNAYSATYQYCFPFLWSQTSNETTSVYPAVYDWYRGTPTVSNVVLLSTNPISVQVTAGEQIDTYECATNYFLVVSRDTNGIRYVQLNGYASVALSDIELIPAPDYAPTVTSIDYAARTLTTSAPLPQNPIVNVGNSGRQVSLQLFGSGTSFTFNDDLLVLEGLIDSLHVTSANTIAITLDQSLLFDGYGNRHSTNMVLTTEDGLWHFRNNTVIESPANTALSTDVFTDANGDGLIDAKMYEFGEGDTASVPVNIIIQRVPGGYTVNNNVAFTGFIKSTNSATFSLAPSIGWQTVTDLLHPLPPTDFHVVEQLKSKPPPKKPSATTD
jgi:hypothetical protein